jgi:hypothetical protein
MAKLVKDQNYLILVSSIRQAANSHKISTKTPLSQS